MYCAWGLVASITDCTTACDILYIDSNFGVKSLIGNVDSKVSF